MARQFRTRRVRPTPEWDADMLRALRSVLGITQRELADAIGVARTSITLWEADERPIGPKSSHVLLTVLSDRPELFFEDTDGL